MTPKEMAKELVDKCLLEVIAADIYNYNLESMNIFIAKQCALIAVNYIIAANPHSNPFNTEVYSTMGYWLKVKGEIELL